MSKSHLPYSAEFRQQMIELVRAGRNPAELAREFGCNGHSIRNWVAQAAVDRCKPLRGKEVSLTSAEREELARLRRQVRQLQMEREILAKATAWFAAGTGHLRTREREPGRLSGAQDVSGVEGLGERLLCLAETPALAAGA